MLTVKVHGREVVAKLYKGEAHAVTYSNRTQAQKRAAALGPDWAVFQWGRPFFVARLTESERIAQEVANEAADAVAQWVERADNPMLARELSELSEEFSDEARKMVVRLHAEPTGTVLPARINEIVGGRALAVLEDMQTATRLSIVCGQWVPKEGLFVGARGILTLEPHEHDWTFLAEN